MSVHKAEGVWPVDTDCATEVPGLFAAGDACGTMQSGAVYASIGMALSGASVTGARAGWGAAAYALQAEKPVIEREELAGRKKVVYGPADRKGGFSPRWVTQVLQNTMIPYFIMYIKHGDRLQAALTHVEFMRDHLVPMLTARDPHELRLAHETRNMVLNAEMRLMASLCRTELEARFAPEPTNIPLLCKVAPSPRDKPLPITIALPCTVASSPRFMPAPKTRALPRSKALSSSFVSTETATTRLWLLAPRSRSRRSASKTAEWRIVAPGSSRREPSDR